MCSRNVFHVVKRYMVLGLVSISQTVGCTTSLSSFAKYKYLQVSILWFKKTWCFVVSNITISRYSIESSLMILHHTLAHSVVCLNNKSLVWVSTRGQFWPSGIVVACVCVCVCLSVRLCVNHLLVRAIIRLLFKLGSPNLDQRCKRPWLRSLLFWGAIDLELQGQI